MRVLLLIATGLIAGCHAEIRGDLFVDGAAFRATECRSGQALGFSGIQLADAEGRRLRLLAKPDGTSAVGMLSPGAPTGEDLGACGVLTTQAQSSRIDGIVNLQGVARLSCRSPSHDVRGTVEFKNCH